MAMPKSAKQYADEVAAHLGPNLDARVAETVKKTVIALGAVEAEARKLRYSALKLAIEAHGVCHSGKLPSAYVELARGFEGYLRGGADEPTQESAS